MQLCLLRHAKAEMVISPDSQVDAKRALTPEGERKMRQVAAGMVSMDLKIEVILSSPYVRARQTAEIAARALGLMESLVLTDSLAAVAGPAEVVEVINARHSARQTILLVGHEPNLGQLASLLLSGRENGLGILFKKAALMSLSSEELKRGKCAVLEWFLTPKQLAAMG